tara:strand:- start:2237 stop:2785 length:549 start_codon:yes stop_codon:yes gene_type:complete
MSDGTLSDIPVSTGAGKATVELTERNRFDLGLLKYRKNLKAYACGLARDAELADDLVQETMVRALSNREKFDCSTNLRAWLFTILKNLFRTKMRRAKREVELTDAMTSGPIFAVAGAQEDTLSLKELKLRINDLPRPQLNAVVLVGALGYSIAEAARRENCPLGTVKSRVSRARSTLASQLS